MTNSGSTKNTTEIALISARWVIPVEPRKTVLEHHCVVVDAGKIAAILPTDKALAQYPGAPVTRLENHALFPGLINAHTHGAMCLLRGYADDYSLQNWLQNHIWPAETRWVDDQFVRDGTELAIAEMISGGTTTFADMYFFPEEVAEVAQQSGMRAIVGLMVMDFPTVWGSGPEEYFAKGMEVYDEVRSLSLVDAMFTPHAPYTVSDEPLRQTLTYADELQVPIQIHVHETRNETQEAEAADGRRPLQRLYDLGLLNPRLTAVHMTDLTDQEIELVSREGVHVVHCPNSNAKLASGQCRVVDLLRAGANVALGTDGAASNNNLDMLHEMRSAALMSKLHSGDAEKLSAWQALEMATINGARAFNLQDQVGSLEVGKAADLCAVDLNHVATQPVYDPVSQLIYSANRDQVSDVWINGNRVLKQGLLQTLDAEKILERAKQWGNKLSQNKNQP